MGRRPALAAVCLAVIGGVVARGVALSDSQSSSVDWLPDRQSLHALLTADSGESLGKSLPPEIEAGVEVFDPSAVVLLVAGKDGKPGRARFDDDRNFRVDDITELGAMGSDDHCLVPTDPGFLQAAQHPDSRVVNRGAFVQLPPSQPLPDVDRYRIVLTGEVDDRAVGWNVELERKPEGE
ncbi:MAG: hypothetical protein AAGA03_12365 [Planctomycetota bacterium]